MWARPLPMLVLLALLGACVEAAPLDADPDSAPDRPDMSSAEPDEAPDQPAVQCLDGWTACGQLCVKLMEDPTSCGQCGRTCVIPHAEAACVDGECAIARCDAERFDVDGQLDNGCEAEDTCVPQRPCETSCKSAGATACINGAASCAPPAEMCNAVDDNCDGQCDEGAMGGCRRGIHRGHQGGGHIFTDDLGAIESVETQNFFFLYQTEPQGVSGGGFKPVFLCNKGNGRKFLTSDLECEQAGGVVKQLGFWAAMPVCGAQPLYRVYSSSAGNHFYTTSAPERDNAVQNLGYRDEGVAGYVWAAP